MAEARTVEAAKAEQNDGAASPSLLRLSRVVTEQDKAMYPCLANPKQNFPTIPKKPL